MDIDFNAFHLSYEVVKQGVEEGNSIYHIAKTYPKVSKSVTTDYCYINEGYLKTKRIDLPCAISYEKRKHNKKYDYSNNMIDCSNHTYLDYLTYRRSHLNEYGCQLDFLGAIKSDPKSILTLIIPELHFTLLKIINKPNQSKVLAYFNQLEERMGWVVLVKYSLSFCPIETPRLVVWMK